VVCERRGRILEGAAESHLDAVEAFEIALDATPDGAQLLNLARAHRLTVYDGLYLELALKCGGAPASLDGSLAAAANGRTLLKPA